jgi:alpha-galactosidase
LEQFGVSDDALDFRIDVDADGTARITRLAPPAPPAATPPGPPAAPDQPAATGLAPALPLLDVVLTGEGKRWSGGRYCESEAGARFRYVSHALDRELRVDLRDPVTEIRAELHYQPHQAAIRTWVRLVNAGRRPVTVESVTSFLAALAPVDGLELRWAESDWLAEGRWQHRPLRDALPDLNRRKHGADPRGRFGLTSTGAWSSGTYLPMGALVSSDNGPAWAWQVEHNGAWHWQAGECTYRGAEGHAPKGSPTAAYIALLGPTDTEHSWHRTLAPGEDFTTVPVTIAVSSGGFEGAIAALTAARRAIRRPHEDRTRLPVIFNDYMNTLMGDPTTGRLLPLVSAAARAGAEYFCIDSGWYAGLDEGWWSSVGAWRPSATRFPNGITEVLGHITANGMVPGLWLEPEVVGIDSPVARSLPDDAFFQRDGIRVAENGRYQLDLRHPAAVKHLDEVIDFLVGDLGIGYLKLDYNISPGSGTDTGGLAAGAGLLGANRAQLDWLDAVLDRHPGLVIENCSSGAMRTDYALLSRLQLQSTSDQEDFMRYPPITAAAPAAITPEQAASWAYPQPSFTDDEIAFTLCSSLPGRLYLSGHLDQMSAAQQALVAEAVAVYKQMRGDVPASVPFWPLGLPRWTSSWIALGLRAPAASYLTVWRRDPGSDAQVTLPVPHLRGAALAPRILYPRLSRGGLSWDLAAATLTVTLPDAPSACLIYL